MLFVLTVSLATVEYLTVSHSLEHALQREENTAFSQHQMVKYSIQTVLLNITDSYTMADMVCRSTAWHTEWAVFCHGKQREKWQ